MEASCSLKFRVGSACSYDRRDRSKLFEVVPLVSCNKDVQGHKSAWCFAGVKNESELNLARAGIFYMSAKDINALTICPFHRSELGFRWRRSQNTCRILDEIASHGKGKGVKGDTGVSRAISKVIFQRTGILVPQDRWEGGKVALKIINNSNIPHFVCKLSLVLRRNFAVE